MIGIVHIERENMKTRIEKYRQKRIELRQANDEYDRLKKRCDELEEKNKEHLKRAEEIINENISLKEEMYKLKKQLSLTDRQRRFKKVIVNHESGMTWYECPNCKIELEEQSEGDVAFCSLCGQAIEW